MSDWVVRGGAVLSGTVSVQGSKNAALPILAATLLAEEPIRLLNCPVIGGDAFGLRAKAKNFSPE